MKALLRRLLPFRFQALLWRCRFTLERRWMPRSTASEIFSAVYSNNRWGGTPGLAYSGAGTHDPRQASPYIDAVRRWLSSVESENKTVVDLGCGDFEIGSQLVDLCGEYVGVDVVASLVEANSKAFTRSNVRFFCLDLTTADLPVGDICILRQVLQHLSNDDIARILPKLDRYRWILLTEHQPSAGEWIAANLDKPTNAHSRLGMGSGVFLDRPPFAMDGSRFRLLVETEDHNSVPIPV